MPKIISIYGKVDDRCIVNYNDGKNNYETSGYAPRELSIASSDEIEFKVDVETGQILNWKFDEEKFLRENSLLKEEE